MQRIARTALRAKRAVLTLKHTYATDATQQGGSVSRSPAPASTPCRAGVLAASLWGWIGIAPLG
jgi:hypothetical protein